MAKVFIPSTPERQPRTNGVRGTPGSQAVTIAGKLEVRKLCAKDKRSVHALLTNTWSKHPILDPEIRPHFLGEEGQEEALGGWLMWLNSGITRVVAMSNGGVGGAVVFKRSTRTSLQWVWTFCLLLLCIFFHGRKFAVGLWSYLRALDSKQKLFSPVEHLHLIIISVDRSSGEALSMETKLLKSVLRIADTDELPCYTECYNAESEAFFVLNGFETVAEHWPWQDLPPVNGKGPRVALMLRKPFKLSVPAVVGIFTAEYDDDDDDDNDDITSRFVDALRTPTFFVNDMDTPRSSQISLDDLEATQKEWNLSGAWPELATPH